MPPDPSEARARLPSPAREAYLNTGGAGPFPAPAAEAIAGAPARSPGGARMSYAAGEAVAALR